MSFILKDREYNHIVEELLNEVPEFKSVCNLDEQSNLYPIFGQFASFIIDNLEANDQRLIQKSFEFINHYFQLPDIQVKNLFEVQIFESLISSGYSAIVKGYLKGEILKRFEFIEKQFNKS